MNKLIALILFLCLFTASSQVFATTCNPRNCPPGPQGEQGPKGDKGDVGPQGVQGVPGDDNSQQFDYGAYLELIVFETLNTEWGVMATHEVQSSETRVLVGGKVYLNRILKDK